MSGERHQLVNAHTLNVTKGDLLGEMSYQPNNDFLRSVLINDGASGAMTSYYEGARESDLLAWGNLHLYRRRFLEELLGRFPLGDIFTTGLPQGDADRYRLS